MNTINTVYYNHDYNSPYINKKITKLQQQGRPFITTPCFSYQSKEKPVKLNGMAKGFINDPNYNIEYTLAHGKKIPPKIIRCRHLVDRYINTDQPKSVYLSSINTKEKLENHPDFLIDHFRLYNSRNSELAYYFSLDQLPIVIQKLIIDECIKKNKEEICFLLCSSTHAMAIRIKQKIEEGVFIIYFYDPNETNIHKKIVINNINDLNKLTSGIIFTNKNLTYFQEDIPTACILSGNVSENKTENLNIFGEISPTILYLMTQNEHVDDDFLEIILKDDNNKTFNFNMLNAKKSGIPSLNMALTLNKATAVRALLKASTTYNLSYKDKITLLEAKDNYGNTGLYNAFCANSVEAIEEFCQGILNSGLEYEDKIFLLKATNYIGVSGVDIAQANNLKKSLAIFTKIIEQSNLKEKDKKILLFNDINKYALVISKEKFNKL